MTATLTSKGQITIPQQVRDALGLKAGQKVDFHVLPDGRVELEVLRQMSVEDLQNILPKSKVKLSTEQMDEAIGRAISNARH